jgi:PhzF family phenazine biosynthesis protein
MDSTSRIPYFRVDAFTDRPFAGNPAAVVPLRSWPDDCWLQNVAMEMNLSETAFFVPDPKGFHLRWFTPTVEVDLCGHATLAAAKVLADQNRLADGSSVVFSTRSGALRAMRNGDQFELDFPIQPEAKVEPPPGLIESLGVRPLYVGKNKSDCLVELGSASQVRRLVPDLKLLATVPCRGVIVTARSDSPECDFVSRFFAPAEGVDEDPVTGSAHCCLAEFWGRRLGKTEMVGFQASRRGGAVRVTVRGDRVILGGAAVVVARGELLIQV